jgi:hypothetical protein
MAKKRNELSGLWSMSAPGKSMAKKKTPAGKMAKALTRTEGATRQKAFSAGLSPSI